MNIPAFVDDIRFMTENPDQLFQMSNILIEETEKTGLTINHDKTKLMFLRIRSRRCQIIGNQWTINNHVFEKTNGFKYLEAILNNIYIITTLKN